MKIKTVSTVLTTNSAGQVVESRPVREVAGPVQNLIGQWVDPVAVEESTTGVPVRFVTESVVLNSAGQPVASTPVKGGGVLRTLDVAGPELISNGMFDAGTAGWTDASSAGGLMSWDPAGRMKLTNTSGTARGRQARADMEVGQRYYAFGQNFNADVAGSIGLGTAAGGTQYASRSTNAALKAQHFAAEFTATDPNYHIQLAVALAGQGNWDGIITRKLIPTAFQSGRWFWHDFSGLPDSPFMGISPDGLPWKHMVPQNANHVLPRVESGRLVLDQVGGAVASGGYPHWNFGDGSITGMLCDLSWTGATGPSMAMISGPSVGALPVVADITGGQGTGALHPVFSDTKLDLGVGSGGAVSVLETINYGTPAVRDGSIYRLGWQLDGDLLTGYLPAGQVIQRSNPVFATKKGRIGIAEHFYSTAIAGNIRLHQVGMRLG
jgi:hypothetical protein